jgi:hypothetical protein
LRPLGCAELFRPSQRGSFRAAPCCHCSFHKQILSFYC